ncbi:MAG: serine/threonine-protein kinase, partial [Myxococcota bacterium]
MERFCPHCEASYPADVKRCPADGTPTLIVSKDVWSRFKGRVLDDRWELGELIGQGGMGAVFRGTQIKLQRPVAVKILRKEIAGDRESIGRFFREAKILSKLQHPNIVTMLDFGQDEDTGSLYMVMELLQGRSLASWLATGEAISLRQILVMMEQLAFALSEAHEQEIVHRDLKPENLFLTRDANHLVVLDFGIAKVTDDSVTRLTRTGYIQGTPAYMSPEQAQGRQVGPPTDLYALGVLLYELLSGYEPFRATNVMQVLLQHISDPPKPLV